MRGVVIGLLILVVMTVTVLSFRPGGLRMQLSFAARRLRIGLILAGIYMVVSAAIRLAFPASSWADWAEVGTGAVLAAAFLILAQDPSRVEGG